MGGALKGLIESELTIEEKLFLRNMKRGNGLTIEVRICLNKVLAVLFNFLTFYFIQLINI